MSSEKENEPKENTNNNNEQVVDEDGTIPSKPEEADIVKDIPKDDPLEEPHVDQNEERNEERNEEQNEEPPPPPPPQSPTLDLKVGEEEESPPKQSNKRRRQQLDLDEDDIDLSEEIKLDDPLDPKIACDLEVIKNNPPATPLEIALSETLKRKEAHIDRLSGEVHKLKTFISKRKQTYKRKRKDEGAPTRALSAYNIFVQDRFAKLAKENEAALKSADADAQLKRVPPANLVASTGNQWKELPPEEKAKYEERAKADRKRYEEQMAQYQPPDKQANRKRNKTGYNMFFSAHVMRLKQSETGVPSERGSVARLVGTAWKQLSAEDKQYYEREADKHNGMNPVEKDGDEEEEEDMKRQQMVDPYAHMQHGGHEMHMHPGMPPPMHGGMHQPPQHDPRHHGYAHYPHHVYGQAPHGYYDYSQHHPQSRHHPGRSQGYAQGYPPPQRHPYDQGGPMM